jgi:hypothetical protein
VNPRSETRVAGLRHVGSLHSQIKVISSAAWSPTWRALATINSLAMRAPARSSGLSTANMLGLLGHLSDVRASPKGTADNRTSAPPRTIDPRQATCPGRCPCTDRRFGAASHILLASSMVGSARLRAVTVLCVAKFPLKGYPQIARFASIILSTRERRLWGPQPADARDAHKTSTSLLHKAIGPALAVGPVAFHRHL